MSVSRIAHCSLIGTSRDQMRPVWARSQKISPHPPPPTTSKCRTRGPCRASGHRPGHCLRVSGLASPVRVSVRRAARGSDCCSASASPRRPHLFGSPSRAASGTGVNREGVVSPFLMCQNSQLVFWPTCPASMEASGDTNCPLPGANRVRKITNAIAAIYTAMSALMNPSFLV